MTEVQTVIELSSPIGGLRISATGESFLSESQDGVIRLWDFGKNRPLYELPAADSIAFSPVGRSFVHGGSDGLLKLISLNDQCELQVFTGHVGAIRCVSYSRDGRYLVSGGDDGTLRLWDVDSRLELYREQFDSAVTGADLSATSETALCCLESCEVWECDLLIGQRSRNLPVSEQDNMFAISYSPGNSFGIYVGSGGGLIDLITGREVNTFAGGAGLTAFRHRPRSNLAFSRDDQLVATGQYRGIVEIWRSRPRESVRRIETGATWVYCVEFSPDETTLLCATDVNMHLFDVKTGKEMARFPATPTHANCVRFTPDGRGVLTGHGGLLCDASGMKGLKRGGKYVFHDNVIRHWSWN